MADDMGLPMAWARVHISETTWRIYSIWSSMEFLPEASFGLRVLSLHLSVCLCINHKFVCAIAVQVRITKFGSEVQNTLVKISIFLGGDLPWPWPRSNLTLKSKFTPFWAYQCNNCDNSSPIQGRRSPNLDQECKTHWLRSLLFWGLLDLKLQGQI